MMSWLLFSTKRVSHTNSDVRNLLKIGQIQRNNFNSSISKINYQAHLQEYKFYIST
jgi:hypothetical protein